MFENDVDDIPEAPPERHGPFPDEDDMMVDTHAMEEEAELEAMLSTYEGQTSNQPSQIPESPTLSDDEYDSLFMDLISQPGHSQQQSSEDLVLSGQMDMS